MENSEKWLSTLDEKGFNLWREAMANLRQLHSDVWNGVRFFWSINVVIITGMFVISHQEWATRVEIELVLLCILGFALAYQGRRVFLQHRHYYLQMLLRKTLIEDKLSFYTTKLYNTDLSFPWRVPSDHLESLRKEPENWEESQKLRRGTISRRLHIVYVVIQVLYALSFVTMIGFLIARIAGCPIK
ncbi:MAG: hypothetical protein ABII79_05395 [bacterium]